MTAIVLGHSDFHSW